MPESVCLSMILGNALGRFLSLSSNFSWCICLTDPCGSRRKLRTDSAATSSQTCPTPLEGANRSFHVHLHQRISYWGRLRPTILDRTGRCQLGSALWRFASGPHLGCFLGLCVQPVHFDPHGDRRAGQRQASEDSKPIGTSSVHHQNRYGCSVRSRDWAFWPWNDRRASSRNY